MKTTLGDKFGAVLGALKERVAQAEQTRDLDVFLDANADPVALAERAVLDAAMAWAAGTGTEPSVRLMEAVMALHRARGTH